MLERQDDQAVGKDADHDRGNSVEQVRGVTHNEGGRTAAKLRQINGAEEPDRHPKERSEHE